MEGCNTYNNESERENHVKGKHFICTHRRKSPFAFCGNWSMMIGLD